jgi:glycosyltransferase involved in cell wall biosynthesis
LRVLWLGHRDVEHPLSGGAERTAIEVGRRLVQRGHVVVLSSVASGGNSASTVVNGVRIIRQNGNVRAHLRIPFFLRENGTFDVIVEDLAHVVPWYTSFFSPTPVTYFFRHLHSRTVSGQVSNYTASLLKTIELSYSVLLRKGPFVVESESSKLDLTSLGVPGRRIVRLPHGVDSTKFVPGRKSERPSLIYFGGMRRYKRPDHAIQLMRALRERGVSVSLYMAGSGPMLASLRDLARQLNVADDIQFVGRLSDQSLVEILGRCWVNVHCSVAEGWCYSAMEAMSAGVPTVGYRVPGLSECTVGPPFGQLVHDGDVEELADAVEAALEHQLEWSAACVQRAADFSWEQAAVRWEKHLWRVASGPPGDGPAPIN